ncbi:MAG TPA: response regulator [Terriglobales bacterium]|nr:response regulator [Terriglobales bacterium]
MKPTVLLVDDSRFARIANERALTRAGYQVIGAEDGQRALEIAKANPPNVILLDLMLPKITGVEVLRQLKADSHTRSIPVIVLSSLSDRNKETLLREGAVDMLEKTDDLVRNDSAALIKAVQKVVRATEK